MAGLLTLVLFGSSAPAGASPVAETTAARPAGVAALDQAFRFANAIRSDDQDRAQAEEEVVLEYAAVGALDEAVTRAAQIEGWRRGTALADLARMLAAAGRRDEARTLLAEAGEVRAATAGWQGPRIDAHIAQARAALGDPAARGMAEATAAGDARQYAGRAAATIALQLAAQGDAAAAMAELGTLDGVDDFDAAWWRTVGYLEITRRGSLSRDDRTRALAAARRSAAGVPGWRQGEVLIDIAGEARLQGSRPLAVEVLTEAEKLITAQPATLSVKAELLSRLAAGFAAAGQTTRARPLLESAEKTVGSAMVIEQPALYAVVGEGWSRAGNTGEAAPLYDRALGAATALQNARPRALAVVGILRAMGRAGVAPDQAMAARLTALYAGLKDPW
jgi:hypothetical protein